MAKAPAGARRTSKPVKAARSTKPAKRAKAAKAAPARKAKGTMRAKAGKVKRPMRAKPGKPVRAATKPTRAKPTRAKPTRAKPTRTVRKPAVHLPGSLVVEQPDFVVQLQKGHTAIPIDAATGRLAGQAAPGHTAPAPASQSNPAAASPASPSAVASPSSPASSAHPGTSPQSRAAAGGLTYAGTGVDIHREDKAIEALAGTLTFSRKGFGAPLGGIGHFAGLVDFGADDALVMCTDGVGSKVEIANAMRKWDTVGIDCVAMNVNDCICVGAEPLAFVDYLAVQDPDPELTRQIGVGLNEGCRQAECSLIGGETASLPGIIKGFDLAGTTLGHVKKARIVDGRQIAPGDVLVGLASTGIHSNGYSLARRAFEGAGHKYTDAWPWPADKEYQGKQIGSVLLEPTRIYVAPILGLLRSGIPVHGLSHITGSGLRKLRRIKQEVRYDITDPLPVHPVFQRIQEMGNVEAHEMYKTFNMGMGFVVVVPAAAAKKALKTLRSFVDYEVKVVGKVAAGSGVHHPVGGSH